jgi:hypothetical protein
MAYNRTAELRNMYFQQSRYAANPTLAAKRPYDSLLQWPSNSYFDRLRPDAILLRQALTPYVSPEASTTAEQVFGNQARQQRIGLQHQSNVLYERAFLHAKHLKEVDRRLMDCHKKLSILKMHFPIDAGRTQQNLERLVVQMEQERRTEEINFWKDTAEIRQKLFEDVNAYSATKRRKDMLYGVERQNA